jgi:DNA-binding NtrC family response regulator
MSPAEAFNTTPGNGRKVILVVDDEPGIRDLLLTYLSSKNFKVYCAQDGVKAQEVWRDQGGKIDLLLTDVIMPKCNGIALAKLLQVQNPALKIIYMSGYTPEELAAETGDTPFFRKPFHPRELLEMIRHVLH